MNADARAVIVHDDLQVRGFFGPYKFLSNFSASHIEHEGRLYPSAAAAYHAARFIEPRVKDMFTQARPTDLKTVLELAEARSDWQEIKVGVMGEILEFKFTRRPDLHKGLMDTGEKYLENTIYWDDTFWGVYKNEGQNYLGKVLMQVRSDLRRKPNN